MHKLLCKFANHLGLRPAYSRFIDVGAWTRRFCVEWYACQPPPCTAIFFNRPIGLYTNSHRRQLGGRRKSLSLLACVKHEGNPSFGDTTQTENCRCSPQVQISNIGSCRDQYSFWSPNGEMSTETEREVAVSYWRV